GLGVKTVEAMVDRGMLKSVADLFRLDSEALLTLEGFAEKSAENLLSAIDSSKKIPFDRFLYALGIRNVGEHVAHILARHCGSLDNLSKATEENLKEIHEVGPEVASSISGFFSDKRNRRLLDDLAELGVEVISFMQREGPRPLEGKTFVFTGSLEGFSREEARRLVESLGGRPVSSVSASTDYVVAGKDPGSKLRKARELGVKTISEKKFKELIDRSS
ncbi:MAG: NAD-dependent DNA ligase LigA, partial [Candidatus Krumholzibacteria bacterium]|nr:NAD-dependent DNA ligase LigA [Candidatus Krumholzibacteria bacterium]